MGGPVNKKKKNKISKIITQNILNFENDLNFTIKYFEGTSATQVTKWDNSTDKCKEIKKKKKIN